MLCNRYPVTNQHHAGVAFYLSPHQDQLKAVRDYGAGPSQVQGFVDHQQTPF